MKKNLCVLVSLTLLFCATAGARDPAAVKQQYDAIKANLNEGGDMMVICNVEGLLENGIQKIIEFAGLAAKDEPDAAAFIGILNKLPGFLRANGFYGVQGLGFSAVPADNNLNAIRGFLSLEPAAVSAPLWRGLFGPQGMEMVTPAYLPADTAFARTFACDPGQMWKIVRDGVATLATPEGAQAFEQSLAMSTMMLGIPFDSLINGLGNESFISLQFSPSKTVDLPLGAGGESVAIAEPSILLGIAVKDSTLANLLKTRFCGPGLPATLTATNGMEIITANEPLPLPFPVQLTMALQSNLLLIGSSPAVLDQSLTAAKSGNGLLASEKFKAAFGNLPVKNSGMAYFSPEFTKTIQKIQEAALSSDDSADAEVTRALMKLFGSDEPQQAAVVIQNTPKGILLSGRTTFGGRELLASLAAAPIALLAGVAMPAITQARGNAQTASCFNNLRQIDGAKDQWAIDNGKTIGDTPTDEDLSEYLKEIPTCPAGGTYTAGAIGEEASCSVHGTASGEGVIEEEEFDMESMFEAEPDPDAQNTCISNLRMIEGAKDQWAIEHNITTGTDVSPEDIKPYLKEFPSCPAGGSYILNPVGTPATCDHPGHTLE